MRRRMLKSKIHRATVTAADVDYAGSISLDPELMARAGIVEWEQIVHVDGGNRPVEPRQLQAVAPDGPSD